jgi:hypothetical protein
VTYTRSIMSTKRLRARLERILALVASNQMPVIVTQYLNITEFEYSFLLGLFGTIKILSNYRNFGGFKEPQM